MEICRQKGTETDILKVSGSKRPAKATSRTGTPTAADLATQQSSATDRPQTPTIPDDIDDPSDLSINPDRLSPFSFHRSQVRIETLPHRDIADFAVPPSPPGSPPADVTARFKHFLAIKSATPTVLADSTTASSSIEQTMSATIDETRGAPGATNPGGGGGDGGDDEMVLKLRALAGTASSLTTSSKSHFNAKIWDASALWNPALDTNPLRAIGLSPYDTYASALSTGDGDEGDEENVEGPERERRQLAVPKPTDWPTWAFADGLRTVQSQMAAAIRSRAEKGMVGSSTGGGSSTGDGPRQPAAGRKVDFVSAGSTIVRRPGA